LKIGGFEVHLYFIKTMRVFKCAPIFDIRNFMSFYKDYSKKRVQEIIDNDPIQAED